jgi:gamma-glutamyl-gamma-aminobutyrate hydrolase PuuD
MNKIIVLGDKGYGIPFEKHGDIVHTNSLTDVEKIVEKVKLIVFTGGADVHPSLYDGVYDSRISFCNLERDVVETIIFELALKYDIKMTGICRGCQFLNVMCGGKMYQDIKNHAINSMHGVYFPKIGVTFGMTSTHHQLVLPHSSAKIVAWSSERRSNYYIGPNCEIVNKENWPKYEVEALVYPEKNVFSVQFHPEMMSSNEKGRMLYDNLIDLFINEDINNFTKEVYSLEE